MYRERCTECQRCWCEGYINQEDETVTNAAAFDSASVQFTRQINKGFGFENLSSLVGHRQLINPTRTNHVTRADTRFVKCSTDAQP